MEIGKKAQAVVLSGALVGAMGLAYGILDRQAWRWDTTAGNDFSLTEQTEKVLKELPREVRILAFFRKGGDLDDIFIRRRVDDVLKLYAARSRKIDYRLVDPDLEIETTLQHKVMTDGTIVFVSGPAGREGRKEVTKTQLFDYSGMTEETLPQFMGEGIFTNALLKVTQDQSSVACLLQGYGERSFEGGEPDAVSGAKEILAKNNYEVRPVSFVTGRKIPTDCTLLLIVGPTKTIAGKADERVRDYLEGGGRLFLLADPLTPVGLAETLKLLGVRLSADLVLDPKRHFLMGAHYPAPVLEEHEITHPLRQTNPILGLARSLTIPEGTPEVIPILTTSADAWGETELSEGSEPRFDAASDRKGPLNLGVAVQAEGRPRAVVAGDADFISNGLLEAPGNLDLYLNMVAWLAEDKNQIAIHPKTPEFRTVSLTPASARFIAIFTQAGLPLLVMAAGGIVWFRRRRR